MTLEFLHRLLTEVHTSLHHLHRKVDRLMSSESDLQTDLDTIKTGVASLLDAATANAKTIADLKAQLAAGTPVSQDQLDALEAEARGIVATLTPLAATPPAPPAV